MSPTLPEAPDWRDRITRAREVEIPEAVFLKLQDLGRRFPNTDEPGDDEL